MGEPSAGKELLVVSAVGVNISRRSTGGPRMARAREQPLLGPCRSCLTRLLVNLLFECGLDGREAIG